MPERLSPLYYPSQYRWRTALATKGILGIVLLASFLLKLHNLDHQALTYWDEAFHALVARNLLHHPLKPTLVDMPYLPYDPHNWVNNHVWLHKPILPLWQIMITYAILGVNTFALRLPSALLSTGAVWLTYRIGRECFGAYPGLIAAIIQAFNPAIMLLVHGYLFSDHVDITLLFWVEVGVYFVVRAMRTGQWSDVLLAGGAQGLAYLSKSYLAAIITGLACTAWLLPRVRLSRRSDPCLRGVHVLGLLSATVLTAAPWTLFCMLAYPNEFSHEHAYVWAHLNTEIEIWAAPWDQLIFNYAIVLYHVFYIPVFVAGCTLLWKTFAERQAYLWMLYAWAFGVLIPHLLATTKTPSATLIGLPPFFLLLGVLISEAWQGHRRAWAMWIALMALSLFAPGRIHPESWSGQDVDQMVARFSSVRRESVWLLCNIGGAFFIARILEHAVWAKQRLVGVWSTSRAPVVRWGGIGCATVGMFVLGSQMLRSSLAVTQRNQNEPTFAEIALFAKHHLPHNAVLLFEFPEGEKDREGDHLLTMFRADRTCYRVQSTALQEISCQVIQHGGIPYIVSKQDLPLQLTFLSTQDKRTIYTWGDALVGCAYR